MPITLHRVFNLKIIVIEVNLEFHFHHEDILTRLLNSNMLAQVWPVKVVDR